jgi:hypothetical protein
LEVYENPQEASGVAIALSAGGVYVEQVVFCKGWSGGRIGGPRFGRRKFHLGVGVPDIGRGVCVEVDGRAALLEGWHLSDHGNQADLGAAGTYSGTVGIRTISTSAATLELADAGKVLVVTVGTDITVPADATVNFPVGTRIEIARTTGSPTLTGAAGVTVNGISAPGAASFDSGTYQQGILLKTAANTWILLKMPDQS